LSMFRYYMKLGAEHVELVQLMDKFVPLSRIGIFRNERTRSTPLDPKLKYWCVSYCLGAFWICFVTAQNSVQNGLNWCNKCKSSWHEIASKFFAMNTPDAPHWTLNSCIGAFRSVWLDLSMFV